MATSRSSEASAQRKQRWQPSDKRPSTRHELVKGAFCTVSFASTRPATSSAPSMVPGVSSPGLALTPTPSCDLQMLKTRANLDLC